MKNKRKPIAEIDAAIVLLQAIVSYRQDIQNSFGDRDAVLRKEQDEIQVRRDTLARDCNTADEVISLTRERIAVLRSTRTLLNVDMTGSRIQDLPPQERTKLKLRRALAVIAELERELKGQQ